jgi:hypothetical protein
MPIRILIETTRELAIVVICFAAWSLQEPLITEHVNLVEAEGYTIPTSLCRAITASKAKLSLKEFAESKSLAHLRAWERSIIPWTEDNETVQPWTVEGALMKSLPPTTEQEDINNWCLHWKGCMLNDATNAVIKDDSDRTTLGPMLQVCTTFVDARLSSSITNFRKQAAPEVSLVIESVLSAYKGMIACISPIPLDMLRFRQAQAQA